MPKLSAGNSMRVDEHHLEIMQGICARYGITQSPNGALFLLALLIQIGTG